MKFSTLLRNAALVVGILLAGPASATLINFTANIDGAQAISGAGTGSPGTGVGVMELDDVTNIFSWDISWTNLQGMITNAHFHGPAAPGTSAGVQVSIMFNNPSVGTAILSAPQSADLLAGLWYINIHSTIFGGGEIRGQVLSAAVPEPATFVLLAVGLLSAGFARKRRIY